MSDKLHWGILSTANINQALLDPIRQAERSQLVAVASRSQEKAQAYAQQEQIPKAHGSYKALLADPDVNVIYNPLPNTLHSQWTVKAAEAGKHVLCEKPLVTTLEEWEEVAAAAAEYQVTIVEAFMYLHHPQTRKAQALIQQGRLGKVQLINSWFNFYLPPERTQNIRLNPNLGGGSLWDVGVYPNSMAIVMAQPAQPEAVWASQIVGETGVDVAMRGQIQFSEGVAAQISSGFRTPFREGTYIVGDEGILNIVEPWKPGINGEESRMVLTSRDGTSEEIVTPALNPYLSEVAAMEATILDGADPVVPLDLSRTFLQSVLALYQSAQSGQPVSL